MSAIDLKLSVLRNSSPVSAREGVLAKSGEAGRVPVSSSSSVKLKPLKRGKDSVRLGVLEMDNGSSSDIF
jgi:hypothetical protein